MFDNLLVALGITSPILIALSAAMYFFLKNILEKRIEVYKEKTLEKYKNEMTIKNIEFQHSLSVEFDKVRIIHDRQKEVLTAILSEINNLLIEVYESYNYEKNDYPLYSDVKYRKAKKAVYTNGLFVNSESLKLINIFFKIFQNNTNWIYDAIGPDGDMSFSNYDIRLLELVKNEIFIRFRRQLGIDEQSIGADYSDTIEILSIICENKDLFNETAIYKEILYKKDDIYMVMKEIMKNKLLRDQVNKTFEKIISIDKNHRYSQEDINIVRKYFNAQ